MPNQPRRRHPETFACQVNNRIRKQRIAASTAAEYSIHVNHNRQRQVEVHGAGRTFAAETYLRFCTGTTIRSCYEKKTHAAQNNTQLIALGEKGIHFLPSSAMVEPTWQVACESFARPGELLYLAALSCEEK